MGAYCWFIEGDYSEFVEVMWSIVGLERAPCDRAGFAMEREGQATLPLYLYSGHLVVEMMMVSLGHHHTSMHT